MALAGCDDPSAEPASPGTLAVLAAVADDVVRPAVERFEARAAELSVADDADLPEAFERAADAWQELEVLQIGPAGAAGSVVGGSDLRDEVNSWPRSNPCRVDQEVVEMGYADPGFFAAEHVNVYGLDALDYLLFSPAQETICPPQISMRADGLWDELGAEEVRSRRYAYAKAVAGEIHRQAQVLSAAWDPDDGDWGAALALTEDAPTTYPDAATALDDVFAALFYLDLVAKDLKLGRPAGLVDCASDACPDAVESRWGKRSVDHLLANLRAGRTLIEVFRPLLEERGAAGVGESLLSALDGASGALRDLPTDLGAIVGSDPAPARDAYAAFKEFTDQLKGPFVTVLSLSIPDEGAGDND